MAVLLILYALGVNLNFPENLPVWKIVVSLVLIYFIVDQLLQKDIPGIFFPLIFIVMIFEKELALLMGIESGDITSTWIFLLIGLLLTIGTAFIFKPFTFTIEDKDGTRVYTGKEGRQVYKEYVSNKSTYYVDCSEPVNRKFELNLGSAEIFFSNADLYEGDGVIEINNNLGKVIFYIPSDWIIDCQVTNSLGSIKMPKRENLNENAKKIKITGENNLGKIVFV